MYGKFTYDLVS